MTTYRRSRSTLFAVLLAVLAVVTGLSITGAPGARAQVDEPADPRAVPVKTLDEAITSGRITKQTVDAAARDGAAAIVIKVKLPSPFRPEGPLTGGQVDQQRQAIAAAQRAILQKIAGRKFSDVKQYETIPWMAMQADTDTLTALVALPEVSRITADKLYDLTLATSVPLIGGDKVRRALGNPGSGMIIAVLDSGVDKSHPSLAGKVVSEACFSTSFPFASSNICPGGSDSTAAGSGVACTIAGANCGHGTHVAGIAAGAGSSVAGVAPGVAAGASLIAVQVFSNRGGTLRAWDSDVTQGLERAYALRNSFAIAAVNLSLGAGSYTSQQDCDDDNGDHKDVIDNLRGAGIATVVSSGNGGLNGAGRFVAGVAAPACISSAISVGATMGPTAASGATPATPEGPGVWPTPAPPAASQTASFLNLLAPGTGIVSSLPGASSGAQTGTSEAAPHVAGAFAVLKALDPSRSVTDILNTLTTTGTPITDTRGGGSITTPRIQLDLAVEAQTGRPLAPSNLRRVSVTGTSIQAAWTDNALSEASFTLTATPVNAGLLPSRRATVGPNQTAATVGTQTAADGTPLKLRPDTEYRLTVRACNAAGQCAESAPITQRTNNTLPSPPTNLRAANVTNSGFELRWDYTGANPVHHFRLQATLSGSVQTPVQIDGALRSHPVSGLTGNWTYNWWLQACDVDNWCTGQVAGPSVQRPNPGSPPAAPTNLHLCGGRELCFAGRITLIWEDNASNEDGYEFEWDVAQQGTQPFAGGGNVVPRPANAESASLTSWTSGLIYYFRVRAHNAYGDSGYSNTVTYTAP